MLTKIGATHRQPPLRPGIENLSGQNQYLIEGEGESDQIEVIDISSSRGHYKKQAIESRKSQSDKSIRENIQKFFHEAIVYDWIFALQLTFALVHASPKDESDKCSLREKLFEVFCDALIKLRGSKKNLTLFKSYLNTLKEFLKENNNLYQSLVYCDLWRQAANAMDKAKKQHLTFLDGLKTFIITNPDAPENLVNKLSTKLLARQKTFLIEKFGASFIDDLYANSQEENNIFALHAKNAVKNVYEFHHKEANNLSSLIIVFMFSLMCSIGMTTISFFSEFDADELDSKYVYLLIFFAIVYFSPKLMKKATEDRSLMQKEYASKANRQKILGEEYQKSLISVKRLVQSDVSEKIFYKPKQARIFVPSASFAPSYPTYIPSTAVVEREAKGQTYTVEKAVAKPTIKTLLTESPSSSLFPSDNIKKPKVKTRPAQTAIVSSTQQLSIVQPVFSSCKEDDGTTLCWEVEGEKVFYREGNKSDKVPGIDAVKLDYRSNTRVSPNYYATLDPDIGKLLADNKAFDKVLKLWRQGDIVGDVGEQGIKIFYGKGLTAHGNIYSMEIKPEKESFRILAREVASTYDKKAKREARLFHFSIILRDK